MKVDRRSFLGLGLRQPVISWGVLLQEAQNVRTVALAPWLLLPGLAVVIAVLLMSLLDRSAGGGVAWLAHVGGFVFGFVVLWVLLRITGRPRPPRKSGGSRIAWPCSTGSATIKRHFQMRRAPQSPMTPLAIYAGALEFGRPPRQSSGGPVTGSRRLKRRRPAAGLGAPIRPSFRRSLPRSSPKSWTMPGEPAPPC